MSEVITPLIKVDVGDSEKSVKGLKQEISDLRDKILNLTKGTDEYNEAVEQLQQNQRDLDNVMSLTKKNATALEGSYDALTQKMSLLKKEWRATADEAKRAELGKQIDDINNQLKEMDASVGNFQRNVGNYVSHWEGMPEVTNNLVALKQEIKDAKNALLQAEEGTEAYNDALVRLGNAQFQLKDMTEAARYATVDLGEQLDNVTKIASSVAAGFSAVQGVMVLMGKEGEDLQKVMVKLQAAMAVVQGLKGLEGLGKQIKGLGVAIKAITGLSMGWVAAIAAVVAGIVLLFKNLPSVKAKQEAYDAQLRLSIKKQEDFKTSIDRGNESLNKRIQLLRAQGVAEKETLKIQTDSAKATSDAAYKNYQDADKQYRSVKQAAEGVNAMSNGAFKSVYGMSKNDALEHYKGIRDAALSTYNETKKAYDDYVHQMKVLEAAEKTAFENRLKAMEESLKKEEQLLKEQYERDLADAKKYGLDTTVITQKYNADLKALREKNKGSAKGASIIAKEAKKTLAETTQQTLTELDTTYNRLIAYAEMAAETESKAAKKSYELTVEKEEKKLEIIKTALKTSLALDKTNAEKVEDLEKKKADKETEIANTTNKTKKAAKQNELKVIEKSLKEAVEAQKANNIITNTLLEQQADTELAIEQAKYNELERLRQENFQNHRNSILGLTVEHQNSMRQLAIDTPSSQEPKKRSVGALLGFDKLDAQKAEKTQRDIDNEYYKQAFVAEQTFLAEKLRLNQEFLAQTTDAETKLQLEQIIADTQLQIDEGMYAEKERLRQLDLQKEQEKQQKTQAIFNASLQATSALLNGIADAYESSNKREQESDEEKKKSAKKVKNLRIAAATIDMFQGATTAFATAMQLGPIAGPIVGGINAAAVIASGIANINKIKGTNADGNEVSGGNGAATPSASSFASELPATYTRQITGASEVDALNQDTRVYILESDIQESNKRVSVRESESSF